MVKASLLTILIMIAGSITTVAQDTFSICAVDPATGEVGSAGASCIAGSIIISDLHPGVGVIHTQSFYLTANQNYARSLMDIRLSPQQIIDSLVANDAGNDPTVRQYGVVDILLGSTRSAAYTGPNCFNYKDHITGPTYAIQGNILLGQSILDSMEARFLRATGPLACRLMESLQGANVPGADTRCLNNGTSSLSAFIRVARPNDTAGNYHLDLNVNSTSNGIEPIDSLQSLFDDWGGCTSGVGIVEPLQDNKIILYPNPSSGDINFLLPSIEDKALLELMDSNGSLVFRKEFSDTGLLKVRDLNLIPGNYIYGVITANRKFMGKLQVE